MGASHDAVLSAFRASGPEGRRALAPLAGYLDPSKGKFSSPEILELIELVEAERSRRQNVARIIRYLPR